jgi:hypothetical protein
MLSDVIASFFATASPAHRALGYLDETLDMRRRARINREAWRPHLGHSRQFVLSSAHRCANKDKIVVLGSGLLLDVPLAELSELFGEVVLKDVVCLPEVRKQIKRYGNVTFVEEDVTGIAGRLHRNRQPGITGLPEAGPPPAYDGASLVVSLNILSQLWVVPRAYAGRHARQLDPAQVDDWCVGIVERHYTWLRSLPCAVCLIADHEAVKRDSTGNIISRTSTVFGLQLPHADASWTWRIAPITRQNAHTSKELVVGAWHLCR